MPSEISDFQSICCIKKCIFLALKIVWNHSDAFENIQVLFPEVYRCFQIPTKSPYTSVCLILFPERAADSKKCLRDMKILNIVSKTLTSPPIILKIFQLEISVVVEISTDFDLLTIVEFQIYSFILPILQANIGKILAKMFSNCTYRNYIKFLVFQKFRHEDFLTPLTIRLVF